MTSDARYGMPPWGQTAFGTLYFCAGTFLAIIAASVMGGLAVLVFIALILVAVYIHDKWKWPAFTRGIFFGVLLALIVVGILAAIL